MKKPFITINTDVSIKGIKKTIHYSNLSFSKGDFVLLKGPNGSGKSTFFNFLIRKHVDVFDELPGASYSIDEDGFGEVISWNETMNSKLKRRITYMGQDEDVNSGRTINEMLSFPTKHALVGGGGKLTREEKENLDEQISYYKEQFLDGLLCGKKNKEKDNSNDHSDETKSHSSDNKKTIRSLASSIKKWIFPNGIYDRTPAHLSGGQKKMVSFISSIIRCRVSKSFLLLLDEPLNDLDSDNKMLVNDLIYDLRDNNKDLIIIMISHCHVIFGVNKTMTMEECESEGRQYKAVITEGGNAPFKCLQRDKNADPERYHKKK